MEIVTEGDKVQMFRCPGGCGTAVPWRFTSCAHERHASEPDGYVKVDPDALVPFLMPIVLAPGVPYLLKQKAATK